MTGAPVDLVAKARLNRGICLGEKGDTDKAIVDFNAVIDIPDIPADLVVRARYNRAVGWSRKGDLDKAMADYIAVIEMTGAPADLAANAREVLDLIRAKKALP
jgi:hypothetical protein